MKLIYGYYYYEIRGLRTSAPRRYSASDLIPMNVGVRCKDVCMEEEECKVVRLVQVRVGVVSSRYGVSAWDQLGPTTSCHIGMS